MAVSCSVCTTLARRAAEKERELNTYQIRVRRKETINDKDEPMEYILFKYRRVPLSIHILAPSMRPVQVTQDLANFWREHYPRIKSELQRKYPKHEWR